MNYDFPKDWPEITREVLNVLRDDFYDLNRDAWGDGLAYVVRSRAGPEKETLVAWQDNAGKIYLRPEIHASLSGLLDGAYL